MKTDQGTQALQTFRQQAGAAFDDLRKKTEQLGAAGANLQKQFSASILSGGALRGAAAESAASLQAAARAGVAYQQSLVSIDAAAQKYARSQNIANKEMKEGTLSLTTLAGGMKGLSSVLATLAAGFGIVLGVQGLIGFGKGLVDAGIAHDRLMLSLKGGLGTTQQAAEGYAFVEATANRLGIGLLTSVEGFAKLSAATRDTIVQGEPTRELFVGIADAARVMGLTTSEVGGIMTATTQIIGKNTVSMEELRQQLGERLPQALRLTAKEMGVTTSTFIQMVSKGEVLAQEFIPAFTRALQQMGKEAPLAAASVQAALERVGNAWITLKITIAKSGLLELVARIAEEMTRVINMTTAWLNRTKRMSGELGIQPMIQELGRLNAEVEKAQKLADESVGAFAPLEEQNKQRLEALKQQRNALHDQIVQRQIALDQVDKVKKAEDAATEAILKNEAAEDRRRQRFQELSKNYTQLEDDIKGVREQLQALSSMDLPSLQGMGLDPLKMSDADLERGIRQRQAALEKELKELEDKRAGIQKGSAERQMREEGESAVERARAAEERLAIRLKREEEMIKTSADERRRIEDEAAVAALAAEGPSAVEAIAAKRSQERRKIALEEAQALEAIRLKAVDDDAKAQEVRLRAQIAAAGKNLSAAVEAQEVLKNLEADTEKERVKIRAQTAEATQQVTKKSADEQIKIARELNKITEEIEQDRIQARISLGDEEISLIQAQVDGEVITRQEGLARIQEIQNQQLAHTQELYIQQARAAELAIEAEVGMTQEGHARILKIREGLQVQLDGLDVQRQTQQQQHLNEQLQDYNRFAQDVKQTIGNVLYDAFTGRLGDIGERIKDWFFRILANLAAAAIANPITLVIKTVVGGLAGAIGGQGLLDLLGLGNLAGAGGAGAAGSQGGLLQMLGLGQLFGPQGILGSAFTWFGNKLQIAGDWLQQAFGIPGRFGGGVVNPMMALGGLAGIGGGIFAALNAKNAGGQVGGSLGALGGGAALLSSLGLLPAVLGPIGLAVAALMPLIGNWIGGMFKEKGPRLVIGQLEGLGVAFEEGALRLTGELTSQLLRRERLPVDVSGAQQAFEQRTTEMVKGLVDVISKTALDPETLLGPTQRALQEALNNAMVINSANAKRFEQDVAEQTRFVTIQIASFFLDPLNMAVEQLESADLPDQIARFGETIAGVGQVFAKMNQELNEIAKVQNTDVLRQLSEVRNRVENFGNQLVEAAGNIAESIVTGVIANADRALERLRSQSSIVQRLSLPGFFQPRFEAAAGLQRGIEGLGAAGFDFSGLQQELERLFASIIEDAFTIIGDAASRGNFQDFLTTVSSIPDAVAALNPALVRIKNLAGAFGQLMAPIQQGIEQLLDSMRTHAERATITAERMVDLRQAIGEAGDAVEVALPLYAQLSQEILANAQAQIAVVNELAQAHIEAERTRYQAVIDAANQAAQAQIEAVNKAAQAAIEAEQKRYQAAIEATNAAYQAEIDRINSIAEEHEAFANEWAEVQRQAIQDWASAQREMINAWSDAANTTADQLRQVNDILLAEMSPRAQQMELEAQRQRLINEVNAGGLGGTRSLTELIRVDQQLLEVAKRSDDLMDQKRIIDELTLIKRALEEQLIALTGESDPVIAQIRVAVSQEAYLKEIERIEREHLEWIEIVQDARLKEIRDWQEATVKGLETERDAVIKAIELERDLTIGAIEADRDAQVLAIDTQRDALVRAIEDERDQTIRAIEAQRDAMVNVIKRDAVYQLQLVQYELQRLFNLQYRQLAGVELPAPTLPALTGALHGGLIRGYATGGMVQVMAEPGEGIFLPQLAAMNTAFPRYTYGGLVPGSGSGDTVSMRLPATSFLLNRTATRAAGYQSGGVVQPTTSMAEGHPIQITINVTQREGQSTRELIEEITRQLRREFRTKNDTGPWR